MSVQEPVDSRIRRERDFHDRRFQGDVDVVSQKSSRFYSVARRSFSAYRDELTAVVAAGGNRVLEFGCGDGSVSFDLAVRGAHVTAIDISPVTVEKARHKLTTLGRLDGSMTFAVMNAEELTFDGCTFDLVCGSAILHHLDIGKAYEQIHRVLKPGGKAVFLEPLGHNPLINLYRKGTPNQRTPDEHPLLEQDVSLARKYFTSVHVQFFNLLTLMAVPFRNKRCFDSILVMFEKLEDELFSRSCRAKRLAWAIVIRLEK